MRYDPNDKNTWMWRTDYGYPHGSVPYITLPDLPDPPPHGYRHETFALRVKRFACAALNHHPRVYTGSWCAGYGYVCSRCMMFADPMPQEQLKAIIDDLNARHASQEELAAVFRGGAPPTQEPT